MKTNSVFSTLMPVLSFVVVSLANAEITNNYSLQSPDRRCDIQVDYGKAGEPNSPTFVLRSGYSRDNDDAAQGHYETAVIDLELVGRRLPSGEVCLFLVTTSTLSEEPENAQGWAGQFYLRRASVFSLDAATKKWVAVSKLAQRGDNFRVITHDVPPYTQAGKYLVADGRTNQRVSIRASNFLGTFKDGTYSGQSYMQSGHTQFANHDASDYNVVRHIIEWAVQLKNGELDGPDTFYATTIAQKSVLRFHNQVRMVIPPWNGSVVVSNNGSSERKFHYVTLMWMDAAVVLCPNNTCAFHKYDLLASLKAETSKNNQLTYESELGRLRPKTAAKSSGGTLNAPTANNREALPGKERRRRRVID